MENKMYLNDIEIAFLNELFFRIDQGGGIVWIEELLDVEKETYLTLSQKIHVKSANEVKLDH